MVQVHTISEYLAALAKGSNLEEVEVVMEFEAGLLSGVIAIDRILGLAPHLDRGTTEEADLVAVTVIADEREDVIEAQQGAGARR